MEYYIDDYINIKIDKAFDGKTLEAFLDYFKQSKKNKYLLIKDNKITVNNQKVTLNYLLKTDDHIKIRLEKEKIDFIRDENLPEVVYEDEFVLVVNKPDKMIVHGEKNKPGALANLVAKYYETNNYAYKVRCIHRLDEDTKGLIMFCKLEFFLPYFDYLIQEKKIKRFYKAIVFGRLDKELIIDKPIGRDRHQANKQRVSKTGKPSQTIVKPLVFKNKYTLAECELFSGRTHQIRVHLSSENLFIVNDPLYGKPSGDFNTMGLYAYKLIWVNPLNNKKIEVELPLLKELNYFKMP